MKSLFVALCVLLVASLGSGQTATSPVLSGDDGQVSYMVWKCCMVGSPLSLPFGFEWKTTILLIRTKAPETTGYDVRVTVTDDNGTSAEYTAYERKSKLEPAQCTSVFFPIHSGQITSVSIKEQRDAQAAHEFSTTHSVSQ